MRTLLLSIVTVLIVGLAVFLRAEPEKDTETSRCACALLDEGPAKA